jgi:hypothetical protein
VNQFVGALGEECRSNSEAELFGGSGRGRFSIEDPLRTIGAEDDRFEGEFHFGPGGGDTDGGMAAGAEFPEQSPFCKHALPGGNMTDAGEDLAELSVAGPAFDPECSLTDCVVHVRGNNPLMNPIREFESLQSGNGQDQSVEFPLIEFVQSRFDVASGFGEVEVGTGVE